MQSEYSILTRDVEDTILPACRALGVGLVAYSPLGRAAGAERGGARTLAARRPGAPPPFSTANRAQNLALVDTLAARAAALGCSLAQLALAWLLAAGPDVVPIPGTKRRRYLEDDVGAAGITLGPDEAAAIRTVIPRDAVAGARYAEDELARVGI